MMNAKNEIKELDDDVKELLRNINRCCMKINEQQNLNCTFKKVEFLEAEKRRSSEGFYDDEVKSSDEEVKSSDEEVRSDGK